MTRMFVVEGHKELTAVLATMETKLQKKILRTATRDAAKAVARDAQRMVPQDTGKLASTIKARARRRSRRNRHSVGHSIIGGSAALIKGLPYYAQFVEFGTVTMDADPFLRPALYGNKAFVKATFLKALRSGLRKLAKSARTPKFEVGHLVADHVVDKVRSKQ